jgi:hypothetical protein
MLNYLKETNSTIKDFTNLILSLFIATCRNVYEANEKEVEKELAEMLKHCPMDYSGYVLQAVKHNLINKTYKKCKKIGIHSINYFLMGAVVIVVELITTYAISVYHHYCCEF